MYRLLCSGLVVLSLIACPARAASEPAAIGPAPEGAFSIVVIPDTHEYRGEETKATPKSTDPVTNPAFEAHVQWIVANLERQRIVFVSHVGDIVDKNMPKQWEVARRCMDRLHGRVPYGIAPGNHDLKASGDSSLFQQYFPASRFAEFPWYGGCFAGKGAVSGNNANSCQLFSAEEMRFVILHLECNAPDDVLAWAGQMLDKHADRRAMITTHMDLGPLEKPKMRRDFFDAPKGRMRWKKVHGVLGNTPQQMWDKLFRKHDNLFLVFCGDQSRTQALRLVSKNDRGKPVHELLSDYHGNWLRVNRFVPASNRIEVYTIDSRNGQLCTGTKYQPDASQHQFALEYEMSGKRR